LAVIKQISIGKGYSNYEFPVVKLTLKSMCEDDMNVNTGKYKTVSLSNAVDDNTNQVLKWIQPCPEIHWAGSLKRNRMFLFNIDSQVDNEDSLEIEIFNPLRNKGKNITSLIQERNLKSVFLKFGMVGTPPPPANALDPLNEVLDFTTAIEDTYGFASLYWKLEGIPQGTYEIQLQSKCSIIGVYSTDFLEFQESTIVGVYDITRPEQYGKPTPLRNDILIGEEISVYFTEEIWCNLPFTFEMKVAIIGTNYTLTRDQLLINCSGKKLGFQIDQSVGIEASRIIGKEFTVEIGQIGGSGTGKLMDLNKNPMDPFRGNIEFRKRFANLDLSSASTAFIFSMTSTDCTNASVNNQSEDVRQEIAFIIGIESIDRVRISGLICQSNSIITANAEIVPSSDRRLLRNKVSSSRSEQDSTDLFYLLKNKLDSRKFQGRELRNDVSRKSYTARAMLVKPSSRDVVKFESSTKDKAEENRLAELAAKREDVFYSQQSRSNDEKAQMNKVLMEKDAVLKEKDFILKAVQKEKEEIKRDKDEMQKEKEEIKREKDEIKTMLEAALKDKTDFERQILAKLG
jgi:hypothetical protein